MLEYMNIILSSQFAKKKNNRNSVYYAYLVCGNLEKLSINCLDDKNSQKHNLYGKKYLLTITYLIDSST